MVVEREIQVEEQEIIVAERFALILCGFNNGIFLRK